MQNGGCYDAASARRIGLRALENALFESPVALVAPVERELGGEGPHACEPVQRDCDYLSAAGRKKSCACTSGASGSACRVQGSLALAKRPHLRPKEKRDRRLLQRDVIAPACKDARGAQDARQLQETE
eukprot:3562515-Prymnesium_polylepis.2